MQKANTKKNKLVALIAAAVFASGVFGLLTPTPALAAKAKVEPAIGYVNRQQIFAGYPGIQDIMTRIQDMRVEAQKGYDEHTKDLPMAEKKAYNDKIALQEAQREDELMKPVGDKIEASIKAVAEEKGLTVVLDEATVVYGGTDITADVVAKVK